MSSPPSLPLSFARHPWFVVNNKGVLSRSEVIAHPHMYGVKTHWGHLSLNALPLWRGWRIFHSSKYSKYVWSVTLHGVVEGEEGSLAARMAACIEQSPEKYPFCDEYAYTGPNSNTYAQWVLNQFPDSGLTLPWNSFGKGFTYTKA